MSVKSAEQQRDRFSHKISTCLPFILLATSNILADTVIILHLNIKLVREGVVGRQCITYMNTALWLGCSIQCGGTAVV